MNKTVVFFQIFSFIFLGARLIFFNLYLPPSQEITPENKTSQKRPSQSQQPQTETKINKFSANLTNPANHINPQKIIIDLIPIFLSLIFRRLPRTIAGHPVCVSIVTKLRMRWFFIQKHAQLV
jgi:hypothetical protein